MTSQDHDERGKKQLEYALLMWIFVGLAALSDVHPILHLVWIAVGWTTYGFGSALWHAWRSVKLEEQGYVRVDRRNPRNRRGF